MHAQDTPADNQREKEDDQHQTEGSHLLANRGCMRSHLRTVIAKEIDLTRRMCKATMMAMDVAEVYSPERVTKVAREVGLRVGWSLGLTTTDEHGEHLGFDRIEMRNKAVRKVLQDQPILFIGSPICMDFSSWMAVNHTKMPPDVVAERMRKARRHLRFCIHLYTIQLEVGRYLLHEHPAGAIPWHEQRVQQVLGQKGVTKMTADQCQYGLLSWDKQGQRHVRKATGFMSNSPCIADRLQEKCPNRHGPVIHRHVRLEGGRPTSAQIYPEGLCRAICGGFRIQLEAVRIRRFLLTTLQGNPGEAREAREQLQKNYKTVEENQDNEFEKAWDDVIGVEFDAEMAKAARKEEVDYIRKMRLYRNVSEEECWRVTGKAPIKVRWVDISKGDVKNPNYRSRFAAKEINTYKRDGLFAATPPLEALKTIMSATATGNKGESIMVNDVSRAFLHAKVKRDVYVALPPEDRTEQDQGKCAKLEFSMYGARDAAINWHDECTQ